MADSVGVTPEPATRPAIEIRGLSRRFGEFTALHGLDLCVPAGCFFACLGANGAGKSTTLRLLTGLLQPTAGDAWIDGHSIRSEPLAVKRRIGVVPDDLALFERLSFWEHLTLVGRIHGLGREVTAARATDLLQGLELYEDRGLLPGAASQGMRKKLALAMALVHRPSVLFLDEPFESIDPIVGKTLRDLLVALARRGVTIFLTSHILEVVERLADRVAILAHGELRLEAAMTEIHATGHTLEEKFVSVAGDSGPGLGTLAWLL